MNDNKKDDMPLISIIIPVYNSFKIIERCLKSLEEQTSRNFEAIFIDDCSTENDYEKLKEELKGYTFNYQIHQNVKNSGPGITRNNGIKVCHGKYITFIDSDDSVSNNFIKRIENTINEEAPDIIIFDGYIEMNHEYKKIYGLPMKEKNISPIDALALSRGECWGKVYKKDIITGNGVTFPELMRSEDLAFCKTYISKCKKIYYLQEPLYYYNKNDQSIMHTKGTMNVSNNMKAFEYIEKNTEKNEAIEMIFIRDYLYIIVQIMILQNSSTSEIKKFIAECNKKYSKWYKNKYIKFQPTYIKIILMLIKYKMIFPLKIVFKLKK